MSFAKILVPLTGGDRDAGVLAGAFAAAKPFQAHVEALFVRPDPVEAMPFYGEGMSSAVAQEIMDVSKGAAKKASDAARAHLDDAVRQANATSGVPQGKSNETTFSYRELEGNFAAQVTFAARLADLIVFGPVRESDRPGLGEAFDTVLIQTGRPVLLISGTGVGELTSHIALAWNGGVASAHAASAAMPFLKMAGAIDILTVSRPGAAPPTSGDLIDYLKLHDVRVNSKIIDGGNQPIADVLLKASTEIGASMLVAGGYGHNRLRELFVTGTTKRVVAQAALPCFLVH
jgi:nucleotide-binding universal stress UspA family protein